MWVMKKFIVGCYEQFGSPEIFVSYFPLMPYVFAIFFPPFSSLDGFWVFLFLLSVCALDEIVH